MNDYTTSIRGNPVNDIRGIQNSSTTGIGLAQAQQKKQSEAQELILRLSRDIENLTLITSQLEKRLESVLMPQESLPQEGEKKLVDSHYQTLLGKSLFEHVEAVERISGSLAFIILRLEN